MKQILATMVAISWVAAASVSAAEQTWTGAVTDSLCGASHARMAQGVNPPLSDHDCTLACVDSGGIYQFVDQKDKNRVLAITNQNFAGLKEHAGHTVLITGELKDNAIVVSKIEMPAAPK